MRKIVTCLAVSVAAVLAGCHSSSDDDADSPGPVVGLDARPSNTSCVAPALGGANAGAAIALQPVFTSLPAFSLPLGMLQAPGDDTRWFVLEKGSGADPAAATARVRVFDNVPNVSAASDFITLTVNAASEGGLLGMAFDPNYATNGYVYLSFTEGSPMVSVVARFTANAARTALQPATRLDILRVNQPFDNHNGGHIAFGPDGNLYVGLGDGGSGGDPLSTAQDTTDLLGSMLRINVANASLATPYAIPPDNPFAGGAHCTADHAVSADNCPEIFAWGLRNPWRWSFDSATGELWVGDVGQGALEEVDRVQIGRNYGWDCREGTSAYVSPAPACSTIPSATLVDPVHEYGRSQGSSITGGYVYRGTALPALVGRYVFADYGSGRIWRLVDDVNGGLRSEELLDTTYGIASFGQDAAGELYVVDLNGGRLYKIVDEGGAAPGGPPVAAALSATGCVVASNPSQPAAGLIPYDVAAPFWSDNALKERWLAVPNGTTVSVGADGDFDFPDGTVLMKHFRLNGALVETRLFMRHPGGEWAGYSYEWNAQGTDAALVPGGKTATVGGQTWIYPSGNDCLACHTAAAGRTLGLEAAQLNHDFAYASTGRTANQLRTLDHIALFPTPLGDPAQQPTMPNPFDTSQPLAQRARAYLHTNCAQCHRPGGPTSVSLDLRYSTPLASMAACDAPPQAGDLGIGVNARIVAPGAPDNSVLVARVVTRGDAAQMPPLASAVVDTEGAELLRSWVAGLTACQ